MSTLARLNIVVAADAAKRTLRDLEGVAKKSAAAIRASFQRAMSVFSGFHRQIFSLKAAFVSLGVGLIVRDFIKVANTLEQVKFQMVAVTKDTKIANEIFKNTRKFATEVSFSFEDLIGSANRMAAQLNGNVKEVDFFLRAAADISAVTGLTVEESTNNLMRMLAAGAASADQFREKGVLAMLGFTAGVSYSADETRKKLLAAFKDGGSIVQGVAKEMSKTFSGVMSMIGDKIFELKAAVMEAGVFDFLKEAAKVINDDLDKAIEDLKKGATTAGETITNYLEIGVMFAASAVDGIRNAMNMFLNFYDAIQSAYNETDRFTGGQIATMGLVGYILFGTAGGILSVAGALLANLSETIVQFLAQTMAQMFDMLATQVKKIGSYVDFGEVVPMGAAVDALKSGLSRTGGGSVADLLNQLKSKDAEGNVNDIRTVYSNAENMLEAFLNPYFDGMTSGQRDIIGGLLKQGGVVAKSDGSGFVANRYQNTTPVIGDMLTSTYGKSLGMAENLKSFDASGTVSLPTLTPEALFDALPEGVKSVVGRTLNSATGGKRPTNTTTAQDYVQSVLDRMPKTSKFKGPPSVLNPPSDPAGSTGSTGSTGTATPLAAHVLQQQLNTEIEKQIELLKSGEITFDKFNSNKELMGKLIAAEIPLVGQLTADQQKEKDGIIALHEATEAYNEILKKLGITYQDTSNKLAEGFVTAAAIAGDVSKRTAEFGQQMYAKLEQGLADFIRTGKFSFKSFMQDLAQEFLIMTAQMAMGKMFTALFGGMFAGGGQMVPNRAYVVGERGREVFVPNEAGRLYPNDQLGGGGVTINQSFDFRNADQFTEARLRQHAMVIQENTRRSIYQDMADGGNISKLSGRR